LPLGDDRATALRRYAEMVETGRSVTAVPECHATRMHKAMRANAKARGIEVKLSLSELEALVNEACGRCSLTGIYFNADRPEGHRIRPWLPSLDRIDAMKGYETGNVRIVCAAVNIAMNQFGEDVLFRIAASLVTKKRFAERATYIGT